MVNRQQPSRRVDCPEPCFIKMRLTIHGGYVPARIHKVLGHLVAEIDGQSADMTDVWASGDIITEAEWLDLIRDRSRARPF